MDRPQRGVARGGPWKGCALSITVGDLVEYREGFRAPCWRRGYVREIARHIYKIEALSSGRVVTIKVGGKGRKGTVRELTGRDLVEAVEATRLLPALPSAVGVTLRVLQGGASVAVPRPRSRFRSPAYLAEVRARPCCNCGAAGPSDPHHAGQHGVGQKADDYTAIPPRGDRTALPARAGGARVRVGGRAGGDDRGPRRGPRAGEVRVVTGLGWAYFQAQGRRMRRRQLTARLFWLSALALFMGGVR